MHLITLTTKQNNHPSSFNFINSQQQHEPKAKKLPIIDLQWRGKGRMKQKIAYIFIVDGLWISEAYDVVGHDISVERQSEKWDAPEEDGGVSCGVAGREGRRGRLEFFWSKKTKKHNNHTLENGTLQRRTLTVSPWCCQRKAHRGHVIQREQDEEDVCRQLWCCQRRSHIRDTEWKCCEFLFFFLSFMGFALGIYQG